MRRKPEDPAKEETDLDARRIGRRMAAVAPLLITRRHVVRVLPVVARELAYWEEKARAIPDPSLKAQAMASLTHKRFHCEGGSVFAAWSKQWITSDPAGTGGAEELGTLTGLDATALDGQALVRFIVAFQTISDYLDNLCDRTESLSLRDFRQLHQSMLDAACVTGECSGDYYRYHPRRDDGGYLEALVTACRKALTGLPRYSRVQERVLRLVRLYTDLQCYKHLEIRRRVPVLVAWYRRHSAACAELEWWEFAAACGSTLGVFALVADAARPSALEADECLEAAYFPWIAAIHILLDYLIDQEEDRRENDLNFVSFYRSPAEMQSRMVWILEKAIESARGLADPPFHLTVVEGLLGLYLSSPKVRDQGLEAVAGALLRRGGLRARLVHAYCRRFWQRSSAWGQRGACGRDPKSAERQTRIWARR